jgi:hypothetical protein
MNAEPSWLFSKNDYNSFMTITHNYFWKATRGYLAIGNQLSLKALQAARQDADRGLRSNENLEKGMWRA